MSGPQRVALVTGAAGNLGQAVARHLRSRGDRLVLFDRDEGRLRSLFGGDPFYLLMSPDLTDASAVQETVRAVLARADRIDVLCNLAGGFRMGEQVHETGDDTWNFLCDLNVRSVLHMCRAVVPGMLAQGRGRIVNVAAAAAQRGVARMGAYTASKSAVIRLTETMAAELRGRGIHVNCVLPTILDTPENRAAMPDADVSQWIRPEDAARVIGFLASDDAVAVSGAAIPLSGAES